MPKTGLPLLMMPSAVSVPMDQEPVVAATWQTFTYVDDRSSRYWRVRQAGCVAEFWWGRIGTAGQRKVKSYRSRAEAVREVNDLVDQKFRKGYLPVGSARPEATAKPAPIPVAGAANPAREATSPISPNRFRALGASREEGED